MRNENHGSSCARIRPRYRLAIVACLDRHLRSFLDHRILDLLPGEPHLRVVSPRLTCYWTPLSSLQLASVKATAAVPYALHLCPRPGRARAPGPGAGLFIQLSVEVNAMKAIFGRIIDWQRLRTWIVNLGAAWFVFGILYLMLTGQFTR